MMKCRIILALAALLLSLRGPASAQCSECGFLIGLDENGNGSLLFAGIPLSPIPGALAPDDPFGPGGPSPALTYVSPLPFTPGDVLLTDVRAGGAVEDVIRFNADNTIVFYSDNSAGSDSLADTGLPTTLYADTVPLPEIGNDLLDGAFYEPGSNDPGYGLSLPVNYLFVSNGDLQSALTTGFVPEPGDLALLMMGGVCGIGFLRKKRRR